MSRLLKKLVRGEIEGTWEKCSGSVPKHKQTGTKWVIYKSDSWMSSESAEITGSTAKPR